MKKKRLLEMARKGKKKAKKQLQKDDLLKIKELLDQELAEAYGEEGQGKDQDVPSHDGLRTDEDKPDSEKDGLIRKELQG